MEGECVSAPWLSLCISHQNKVPETQYMTVTLGKSNKQYKINVGKI
jgi:hypothetical protein